jgi:hypothetical protein
MNRLYRLAIALSIVAVSALAQDGQHNYADCMAAKPSCETSQLSPAQAQAVIANLLGKAASSKPTSQLNEVQQVAQAEHDNNLRNCKLGAYCNKSLLIGSETNEVG